MPNARNCHWRFSLGLLALATCALVLAEWPTGEPEAPEPPAAQRPARHPTPAGAALAIIPPGQEDAERHARFESGEKGYVYQQDLTPLYALVRDDFYVLGHLDAFGDFVPLASAKRFPLPGPSHPREFKWLNVPRKPNEAVYEFRSGKLIRGLLKKDGNFVPQTGSTPIDFKDYRHGKDALRIYNLPGRFIKTGQ